MCFTSLRISYLNSQFAASWYLTGSRHVGTFWTVWLYCGAFFFRTTKIHPTSISCNFLTTELISKFLVLIVSSSSWTSRKWHPLLEPLTPTYPPGTKREADFKNWVNFQPIILGWCTSARSPDGDFSEICFTFGTRWVGRTQKFEW